MPWLSLGLKSFPFLTSSATGMTLEWNHGPMYNVLLTSAYVRINELGIQWSSLCSPSSFSDGVHGWSSAIPCVPVRDAFCLTKTSPAALMFPTNRVELLPGSVPPSDLQSSVTCNPQTANRVLRLGDGGYQVSLCDLIDRKLDVVLDVKNSLMYRRFRNEHLWWSVLLTLSSLFFFTRVCEHLVLLVQGKRREFSWVTTAAISIMLVLHRVIPVPSIFSQHLVTTEEQILDWILEVYSWMHIAVQVITVSYYGDVSFTYLLRRCFINILSASYYGDVSFTYFQLKSSDSTNASPELGKDDEGRKPTSHDVSTLGLLVCVQLILTAHLQGSYDNPFFSILVIIFGMRSFLKFLNFNLVYSVENRSSETTLVIYLKLMFVCIDTFTLASMLELGVRSAARSEVEYVSTASGILLITVLGGAFLHEVIHRKR
jgi:hypothetical protein